MNNAPDFFTLKQQKSFYNTEKSRQDGCINNIRLNLSKLPDFTPGSSAHIESVRLRVALNDARKNREWYRRKLMRIREKMNH